MVKFALSDDEVDYTIIQKYGRTVGKEKIEKNTPIFEALTNQNYAQKYRLISVSNPNLLRLPNLALSGDAAVSSTNNVVTLGRNNSKTSTIFIEQTIINENSIDVELRDQTFIVEVNDQFLQVLRSSPDNIDGNSKATYILTRSANENSLNGSILQFTLSVKAVTEAQFNVFGSTANKNIITTYVKVSGAQSGAVKEFRVTVNKLI